MKKFIVKFAILAIWSIFAPTFGSEVLEINDLEGESISTMDLSAVKEINLRENQNPDNIIKELAKNKTLRSLKKIDLSSSNISLEALKLLKKALPNRGFVRPFVQVSGRFGCQVVCIEVDVTNTVVAHENQWELNNIIAKPGDKRIPVFYQADNSLDDEGAYLQILPRY